MKTTRDDLLAAYVKRLVDSAPPLTAEQRDRLPALLPPPSARENSAHGRTRA